MLDTQHSQTPPRVVINLVAHKQQCVFLLAERVINITVTPVYS
jgi:hypothetical protein